MQLFRNNTFLQKMFRSAKSHDIFIDDEHPSSYDGDYVALSNTTSTSIFTIPTGKTGHIAALIITNKETAAQLFTLYDDTDVRAEIYVANQTTIVLSREELIALQPFTTNLKVKAASYSAGSSISCGFRLRDTQTV